MSSEVLTDKLVRYNYVHLEDHRIKPLTVLLPPTPEERAARRLRRILPAVMLQLVKGKKWQKQ